MEYFFYMYSLCSVCLCGEGNACHHVRTHSFRHQACPAVSTGAV